MSTPSNYVEQTGAAIRFGTLDYTLIGGTDPHYFTIQAPVKDSLDPGINTGFPVKERFEFSPGLDGVLRRNLSGSVITGNCTIPFNRWSSALCAAVQCSKGWKVGFPTFWKRVGCTA